jgi:hypothetical protein
MLNSPRMAGVVGLLQRPPFVGALCPGMDTWRILDSGGNPHVIMATRQQAAT